MPKGTNDTSYRHPPRLAAAAVRDAADQEAAAPPSEGATSPVEGGWKREDAALPVSAAGAELGIDPAGGREGEASMAAIVSFAEVVFRLPNAKQIVAEALGLKVAELRAEVAGVIVTRMKAPGVSPTKARKTQWRSPSTSPG
jgi:hypothetical protein